MRICVFRVFILVLNEGSGQKDGPVVTFVKGFSLWDGSLYNDQKTARIDARATRHLRQKKVTRKKKKTKKFC